MASVTSKFLAPTPGPSPGARKGLFYKIGSSRRQRSPRIVLYGVQGVGKSTWASQSPKPIFLCTEEGIDNLDVDSFPLLTSWADVQEAIESLNREEHEFQTLVLDSLDRLEALIWQDVCAENKWRTIEDPGYAKGYVVALSRWTWLTQALDSLRDQRDMGVILIGHAKIERFESPESSNYDRYGLRLNKHAAAMVQEWADHVFFATYEVFVHTEDMGFGKKKGKAVGRGNRVMRTTERPYASAKSRVALPDEMPLEWEQFARYLAAGPAPEANNQPQNGE